MSRPSATASGDVDAETSDGQATPSAVNNIIEKVRVLISIALRHPWLG